ncbi:hypothetical protein GW17_00046297 [Ensete ventricosum]|uniref:Uncharacterized protein n=1 Tax=Ensete ventricosum TaxID=4639 RepID=A0A426ZJ56_ENSVE|nr:hypothetical protein B296_00002663 [Ensete ventricosum]RWV91416.1 hypothetical protein GW17_00046297 [Ensete ventricosum]
MEESSKTKGKPTCKNATTATAPSTAARTASAATPWVGRHLRPAAPSLSISPPALETTRWAGFAPLDRFAGIRRATSDKGFGFVGGRKRDGDAEIKREPTHEGWGRMERAVAVVGRAHRVGKRRNSCSKGGRPRGMRWLRSRPVPRGPLTAPWAAPKNCVLATTAAVFYKVKIIFYDKNPN